MEQLDGHRHAGEKAMPILTTKDATAIYYKDWGTGKPVVFSHGWPLSSDAWEDQMIFLASHGFRCIAHDRRGHGRSGQPWWGNDMDTYAADLAELMEALDLKEATLIGHSTGGGEVARYIGRQGSVRVAKVVLIGSVTPLMLQTPENPTGVPLAVFDEIRAKMHADRSQFFQELPETFYGGLASKGLRDSFWMQGMQAGFKGATDCITAFSETDFTEDLEKFSIPTLIVHGDEDVIVPMENTAMVAEQLIPDCSVKVYAGAPHGLCSTHKDKLNDDLLAFLR